MKLWRRAVLAWMLIILIETLNDAVREIFIAPHIGDLPARQIGVLVGCLFIFAIAWLTARWIGTQKRWERLGVGILWVTLTLTFEIAFGSERDGLMLFGLAFMCVAPLLAARLRKMDAGKNS